jgi:tetratricopeptide (TPR) repeat protein
MRSDLSELAEQIVDGTSIDWNAVEAAAASPEVADRCRRLRVISRIADVHRVGLPPSVSPLPDPAGSAERGPGQSGTRWGNLQILEHIGGGTFGDVYRARAPRLDREVALKLLRNPERASASHEPEVVAEGRLLARVRHPNVAAVFGADRIDGRVGVWMELVDGHTLEDEIGATGPLNADAVIRIGVDLCRALSAVHAAGLLHRDIKAQNVLRDRRDGRIVLTDFSAGRDLLDPALGAGGLPRTLAGSPLYVAPELLNGGSASVRSDLYSLGVLLFRLATGSFPVTGDSLSAIAAAHRAGRRSVIADVRPDVPADLGRVIDRMLQADPAERFESAAGIEHALIEMRQPGSADVVVPRRRGWTAALAVLAAVAIGAVSIPTIGLWRVSRVDPAQSGLVLIIPFDNQTGESRFGGMLEQMLERELAQQGHVRSAPAARVEQTLKFMRKPAGVALTNDLARDLSLRDGDIRVVVTGQLQRLESSYSLSTTLVNPSDGAIVANFSRDLPATADLLRELRGEAARVRDALPAALASIPRIPSRLEKVTTSSLHALELYSRAATLLSGEGWLLINAMRSAAWQPEPPGTNRFASAEALLRQATVEDPSFASAWLLLAHAIFVQSRPVPEFLPLSERALELSRDVSSPERYFIQGVAHRHRTYAAPDANGNLDASARAFEALLALEPAHYWALLELAPVYRYLGRIDDAERVVLAAAAAHPDSLLFAVESAKVQLRRRNAAAVREIAARVLANPGADIETGSTTLVNAISWIRLWEVHDAWLDQDVTRTLAAVRRAEATWPHTKRFLWQIHLDAVYQGLGRFADATRVAASMPEIYRAFTLAHIAARREDREELRRLTEPDAKRFEVMHNRAGMLARSGWLETAEGVQQERRRRNMQMRWEELGYDLGSLRVAQGRYAEGLDLLMPFTRYGTWGNPNSPGVFEQSAIALRAIGDRAAATRILEDVGAKPAVAVNGRWGVFDWLGCRVVLSELYAESGRKADASRIAHQVRTLLSAADPGHPMLARIAGF